MDNPVRENPVQVFPVLDEVLRFFLFDPLGLDSGRMMTPFEKCVFSNRSKKTNNPNPSPTGKIRFGLYCFDVGNRNRNCTVAY